MPSQPYKEYKLLYYVSLQECEDGMNKLIAGDGWSLHTLIPVERNIFTVVMERTITPVHA